MVIWDRNMKQLHAINLATMVPAGSRITALDFNEEKKAFLVGTAGAEIFEVSAQGQKSLNLVTGHYGIPKDLDLANSNKISCVACNPKRPDGQERDPTKLQFVTAGTDKCIRFWSALEQVAVISDCPEEIVAIDWSPCGNFLVLGDA